MSLNFKEICRACLRSGQQTFDIYTCYYAKGNKLYSEMLSSCTKLKPFDGDGLPRLICKECIKLLRRAFTFNIQCEDSDKTLKSYLQNNLESEVFAQKTNLESQVFDQKTNIDTEVFEQKEEKKEKKFDDILNSNVQFNTDTVCFQDAKQEFNEEIKTEPNDDDSGWDAEDDNLLLGNIKSKKGLENTEEKQKKKRGRKKRVFQEGETTLPKSKLPHQCGDCGKILSTRSNLRAHQLCHTDLRPYECTECSASFRGYSALFQHRKLHTGETPYHCEYCPKQFSRRTGLVNHVRIHTGDKQYSCTICFKNFIQSAQLSIHMKRHIGDKPFLCQDCGKGFAINNDLKVHRRIHNGEKPYGCHLCNKRFATSGNLSIHVRIHNKEIRYHCKECQRGFVTCSAFNVHVKRHKGQRDYLCECGKTFYTSSALKQHKVVHTGEKKYQCKICDKKFSQTSHLSRHFKKDHAKPNAPIPSSDHYKLIVLPFNQNGESAFNLYDSADKTGLNGTVKCEETRVS